MLDIGWTELLVIGIVALIVVGPKDLPVMFHNLGKFTARLRTMAREFTRAMDDAAQASGAKDMARDLRAMSNSTSAGKKAFTKATGFDMDDPFGEDEDDDAPAKTPSKDHGPNTAKLAEERAAAAKKRREDAAARANERAAAFEGFETADGDAPAAPAEQADAAAVPAPAPGTGAPRPAAPAAEGSSTAAADQDKA